MNNLTLRWILEESGMSDISCVCGKENLDNEVKGVQIMDNPDTIKYHQPGDVVLTTGYLLQSNPIFRKTLISELVSRECAGILFKINRFFEQVPSDIIQQASKYNLPILELPFDYSLSEINKLLMKQLLSSKEAHAQNILTLISEISQCFMSATNWSDGFSILAKYLNTPVLIFSPSLTLEYSGFYGDQLKHLGVKYLSPDNCHIVGSEDVVSTYSLSVNQFTMVELQLGSGIRTGKMWPLLNGDVLVGYFFTVNSLEDNRLFTDNDINLILPNISLALSNHISSRQSQVNIDNQQLGQILHNSYISKEEISNICQLYNFIDGMNYVCMSVQTSESSPVKLNKIRHQIHDMFTSYHLRTYFYQEKKTLDCLVYRVSKDESNHEILKEIYNMMKSICVNDLAQNIYVGIGCFHDTTSEIHQCYLEAQKSIFLGSKLDFHSPVFLYENQYIFHFLYNIASRAELENIVNSALKPLIQYDTDNGTNLLSSLVMLVLHQWNLKDSASALYIHRNTICYRKDQIVTILHLDMQDAHQMAYITLAVYCHIILEWYYDSNH